MKKQYKEKIAFVLILLGVAITSFGIARTAELNHKYMNIDAPSSEYIAFLEKDYPCYDKEGKVIRSQVCHNDYMTYEEFNTKWQQNNTVDRILPYIILSSVGVMILGQGVTLNFEAKQHA